MNPLLFILGAAGVVWCVVLFRRGGLVAACLLTLLTGTCFGAEFFQVSMLTLDRFMILVCLFAYVIMRRLSLTDPKPLGKADVLVGMFLTILVLSTFTHEWNWHNNLPVSRLGFYYLLPATVYWLARQAHVTHEGLRRTFLAVGLFGLYIAVTAVAETQGQYWAVFPRYIVSPENVEFLGRGRGPLLNPSGNGILMCLGLFSLLTLWPRLRMPGRIALCAAFLIFVAGIHSTLTRSAWLGAALGLMIVVNETFPRQLKKIVIVGSLVSAAVFLPMSWDKLIAFKRDKHVSVVDMQKSARLRPILAFVAWQVFQDKPVFGLGLGQYDHYNGYYLSDRSTKLIVETARPYHQHNVFLSLLTETGLVGMGLYAAMLLAWCVDAMRLWRCRSVDLPYRQLGLLFLAVFAAYLANGMFQDVTIIPMVHMVVFFLAGLMVGQHQRFLVRAGVCRPTASSPASFGQPWPAR